MGVFCQPHASYPMQTVAFLQQTKPHESEGDIPIGLWKLKNQMLADVVGVRGGVNSSLPVQTLNNALQRYHVGLRQHATSLLPVALTYHRSTLINKHSFLMLRCQIIWRTFPHHTARTLPTSTQRSLSPTTRKTSVLWLTAVPQFDPAKELVRAILLAWG